MLGAAFLFALMGVCVKLASLRYGAGEIVMYRSLVGVLFISLWVRGRGGSLRTRVPGMHAWRATVGVISLALWFYAIGSGLPLATAMTLNYMSSVWMALFLIGGAVIMGGTRVDGRLIATVLAGFVGVALVLRPTMAQDQLWHGLTGLGSGMIAALAYLQVSALGRVGEPDYRIVFYFSAGGVLVGAALAQLEGGFTGHDLRGAALLLAVGALATVAQLMMTRAYAIGTPLINASLHYTGIGFAFLFGVLWFDEAVSAMALAGIVLIVGAGVAASLLRARLAAQPAPE
ncbi:MAG: DMT family transporter [Burkholderiaceae bacterium]|nr:DMT family transporter [Burkholderiaceae bacterium]